MRQRDRSTDDGTQTNDGTKKIDQQKKPSTHTRAYTCTLVQMKGKCTSVVIEIDEIGRNVK